MGSSQGRKVQALLTKMRTVADEEKELNEGWRKDVARENNNNIIRRRKKSTISGRECSDPIGEGAGADAKR